MASHLADNYRNLHLHLLLYTPGYKMQGCKALFGLGLEDHDLVLVARDLELEI